MAKRRNDAMLDAALNYLKTNAGTITVCNAQPTTNAEAITTYALADVAVDTNDFAVGNGDTNGRKVTVGAQSGVLIDTSGTASHIALTGAPTLVLPAHGPGRRTVHYAARRGAPAASSRTDAAAGERDAPAARTRATVYANEREDHGY